MTYKLTDTHCHITCENLFQRVDEVIQLAQEHQVHRMLVVCTNFEEYERAAILKEKVSGIDIAFGFHPNDLDAITEDAYTRLEKLAEDKQLVAIGEIGLDYHYEPVDINQQQEGFIRQITIAKKYNLPILIHMRDATKDTLEILKNQQPCRGILHCYSGSYETAKIAMDLGFYISFGGPLTFKNSKGAPEVAKRIPPERLFIETDCPYLTPHPFRGKQNEPMYLNYTFKKLCEIKSISEEEMADRLEQNYCTLFSENL